MRRFIGIHKKNPKERDEEFKEKGVCHLSPMKGELTKVL